MAINIGDLVVSLSTSTIQTPIGITSPLKITFTNNSTTSPGYNLTCKITLPDGVSFSSASIPGEVISYSGNNQIVEFPNIKDLYPNESYSIDVNVLVNETYRSTGLPVPFNTIISGVSVEGILDSMPRGDVDPGNIKVTAIAAATATGLRYYFKIVFPKVSLKGAGANLSTPATNPFDISFEITNNTRESSSLSSIDLTLANGIRYIDTNYNVIGPDTTQFQTPIITNIGLGNDAYKITFNSPTLSAGSTNIVNFEGAIFNNYTANGIVNSGAYIANNTQLTSQASVAYAGAFDYAYEAVAALELIIKKESAQSTTDVSQVNNFTLNYELGGYSSLSGIIINDYIGNGLSYDIGSVSVPFTTITDLGNGITKIAWDLGALAANTKSSITFSATTLAQYFNGTFVSAGDTLNNTMEAQFNDPTTEQTYTLTSEVNLDVPIPTITKSITGYFTEDGTPKVIQNATKGEYVGFLISYDGTGITAKQSDVKVYDYAPLSMLLTSIPSPINYTGNIPPEITPELTSGNGILWNIGDLESNSVFTIAFRVQVTDFNSIFQDNLAKMDLVSSDGIGYSIRDSVTVAIASSNPSLISQVTATTTPVNSAALNSVYNYTVTATNIDLSAAGNPTSTIYNSTITIDLPPELSFYNNGLPDVTPVATISGGVLGTGTIVSPTQYVLPVNVLEPDGDITITFQGLANIALVAKKDYIVTSSMTRGTTALTPPYDTYPGPNLVATSTIRAKNVDITIDVTPNPVPLHGTYSNVTTLTIPEGIIAYNVKLKDTTISNNNALVTNVLINGSPPSSYTIVNNILNVNVANIADATAGAITYTLTFDDVATNFTQSGVYTQTKPLTAQTNWGGTPSEVNAYNRAANTSITIDAPNLTASKLQRNVTTSSSFTTDTLVAAANNSCQYKFQIENIGYSTAYDVVITDILPANIDFVSFGNVSGVYDSLTRTITFTLASISTTEPTDIYFNVAVNSSIPSDYLIGTNGGSVQYNSIAGDSTHFTVTTNTVSLVTKPLTIEKLQRNPTISSEFVTTPETIIIGQQISYKLTITNTSSETLTNLNIQDIFPPDLTFVSFEPFPEGTLSVTGNNITGTLASLAAGASIEIIYTVAMNKNVLKTYSTNASVTYRISSQGTDFTTVSNSVVTSLYGAGRGYTIY